jgi:hypothetical protein
MDANRAPGVQHVLPIGDRFLAPDSSRSNVATWIGLRLTVQNGLSFQLTDGQGNTSLQAFQPSCISNSTIASPTTRKGSCAMACISASEFEN